ncbi:YEATS domain-containing protein 4-like isoform X2 [Suncus etruscus]|uniref:YEATS domain-containing protein 4-like isoform X2 n=1 Tax=Suncus etruscus TaxID=109475 RepID=UPI00210FA159|nr:YEATS domain-containing protein 4-like isoform X2 [Suncus etruscus]
MFQKMAEFGPDSGGRMKGVTIVKPIVYGNVARYFGKEREEDGHTHEWTVYVKPYINEVTLYHLLKLFPSDTNAMLGEQKVVSEFYDEMIFQEPTALMQELLTTSRLLTLGTYKHETDFAELEMKTRKKLEAAQKRTSLEIEKFKERLKANLEAINGLKNEIRQLEDDQVNEI